jgi:hypothetical protein
MPQARASTISQVRALRQAHPEGASQGHARGDAMRQVSERPGAVQAELQKPFMRRMAHQ